MQMTFEKSGIPWQPDRSIRRIKPETAVVFFFPFTVAVLGRSVLPVMLCRCECHSDLIDIKGFIDIMANTINMKVSEDELARRRAAWKPRAPRITTGYLSRYASLVTSGNTGAILKAPDAE